MAGERGPGPAESVQDPTHGSGAPSEAGNGRAGEERDGGHRDGEPGPGEPAAEQQGGSEQAAGDERTAEPAEPAPAGGEQEVGEQAAAEPAWPPAEEGLAEPPPMRQVAFMGVAIELPNTNPAIVLQEIDPPRRELRVTIAQPDGVAIAYAWRGMTTPRPLTHDLLTTIIQRFGLQVDAVRIVAVDGPVFHAELALSGPTGSHTVECRPSDAVALALRQPLPVPITVAEEVLVTAGRLLA